MSQSERVRRNCAGLNRSLSKDFIWPENFGRHQFSKPEEDSRIKMADFDQERNETSSTKMNLSAQKEKLSKKLDDDLEIESDHSVKSLETKISSSKNTGSTSLSVTRRRIALEAVKKRHDLEMKMKRIDLEKQEILKAIQFVNMEEDLRKDEASASSHKSKISGELYMPENRLKKEETSEWVNNLPDEYTEVPDNHKILEIKQTGNEIKLLCDTIQEVIRSTKSTRNSLDRDFPYFDGNPKDWPLFIKHFNHIISLSDYSDIEITLKLQKCLKGQARAAVADIMLTSDVSKIMETLETRFGRPENIIDMLLMKIRGIPIIRDTNLEKIISFSTEVNNLVATIKSLNSLDHLQNPQLRKEILTKLPDTLKLKWGEFILERKHMKQVVNLEDFSKWLSFYSNAACQVSYQQNLESYDKQKFYNSNMKKCERVYTTSNNYQSVCYYCSKVVHEGYCPQMQIDDIDTRWKKITTNKLCFSCLKRNHQSKKCRRKKPCGQNGCILTHHPLLHKDIKSTDADNTNSTNADISNIVGTMTSKATVLLRFIPLKIHGPNGTLKIYALCDEGSTVTLLQDKIANQIGIKGEKESLCLQWTNDDVIKEENSTRLDINISRTDNDDTFLLRGIRTVSNLSLPEQSFDLNDHPHLEGTPIENYKKVKPVMIIGQDNIDLIIPRRIQSIPANTVVASKSKLGWSAHGPIQSDVPNRVGYHIFHICDKIEDEQDLKEIMEKFYTTESFGTIPLDKMEVNEDDTRANEIMNRTIKKVGERYEIGLLWKNDDCKMPESYARAMQRLKCTERKCLKDENLAKEYCAKIEDHLRKNYIRKLSEEEIKNCGPRTWYLPHFAVINPNKKKIRVVFDAASKSGGVSLNDMLLSGPDQLQSLIEILWKFRQRKIGFCGDIREMFHRVMIRQEDRDSQRILWRNLQMNRKPDVYELNVMTFGAKCSPACAQFVKNYHATHFAEEEIQRSIIKKFYVDDYLESEDDDDAAILKITKVRDIMKSAGFDVVNLVSNSKKITELLESKSQKEQLVNMNFATTHRVLGMWWNIDTDDFEFKIDTKECANLLATKRNVLKSIMRFFDPLGILSHLLIGGKILMQRIWKSGTHWDEEIPSNLKQYWVKLLEDLQKISEIRIPRCYSPLIPFAEKIEIHTFTDSSEDAFAAVSYLRIVGQGKVDIAFLASKTRVAPLKPLSIPRLELQAAVLGSRLTTSLSTKLELKINDIFLWTDSQCVLSWIRCDGTRFKPFVSHRINEIQALTNPEQWKWISTKINPADLATRPKVLKENFDLWFQGPEFLNQPFELWPDQPELTSKSDDNELKHQRETNRCLHMNETTYSSPLPDISRFSKFSRLIGSTACFLRAISIMKSQMKNVETKRIPNEHKEVKLEDKDRAEKLWIQRSQYESFSDDLRRLRNNMELDRNSFLFPLCPKIKDGLIVATGRTNLSPELNDCTKEPIILSPKHKFTILLIEKYHERYNHQGVETVLNELRQKFWILNARAAVKSVFFKCLKCKINRATPKPPLMGQLPDIRLTRGIRAFVNIGLDYFGPINVKIGRRIEKRWGVLFTCMAIRAIHLEVAYSLTSNSAIQAIMRFSARRGTPDTIICDNGTNFRAASKELKEAFKQMDLAYIQDILTTKGIKFKFNPPAAPHMGGCWERLIGSVKRVIGKLLYQQPLKEETLLTLLAEAEFIVNSRPLTRVSSDPNDLESITPNHFILGSSSGLGPPMPEISDAKCLRNEWKRVRFMTECFWKRWIKEYLPTLTKRNKWTNDQKAIGVGDLVLIIDENLPRFHWRLGRITNTYSGIDGRIRVVDVRTSSGEFKRPVHKICRLELDG